jgi:uncharacterized protein (DUF58 family)
MPDCRGSPARRDAEAVTGGFRSPADEGASAGGGVRARRLALDPAVAERLKHLSLSATRTVEGFLAGRHRSPHRGVSVEFVERRPYVHGDDLRHLDWKSFARNDRLAIKRYEEETNLECTLVVDCSASMAYPHRAADITGEPLPAEDGAAPSKYDYACQVAAALSHLVLRERDGAALALFDHALDRVLPASTSPSHLEPILAALAERRPHGVTDLGAVLRRLNERIARPGIVVLVSDLFGDTENLVSGLGALAARRHDTVVLHVMHADELRFPFDRLTRFEGLEDDGRLLVDAPSLRESYLEVLEEWRAEVRAACGRRGVDYHLLDTGTPLDVGLSAYLGAREARQGRRG